MVSSLLGTPGCSMLIVTLDAVGAVGFHPLRPVLLSASGSRNFDYDSKSESEEDSGEEETLDQNKRLYWKRRRDGPIAKDASVKLWDFTLLE